MSYTQERERYSSKLAHRCAACDSTKLTYDDELCAGCDAANNGVNPAHGGEAALASEVAADGRTLALHTAKDGSYTLFIDDKAVADFGHDITRAMVSYGRALAEASSTKPQTTERAPEASGTKERPQVVASEGMEDLKAKLSEWQYRAHVIAVHPLKTVGALFALWVGGLGWILGSIWRYSFDQTEEYKTDHEMIRRADGKSGSSTLNHSRDHHDRIKLHLQIEAAVLAIVAIAGIVTYFALWGEWWHRNQTVLLLLLFTNQAVVLPLIGAGTRPAEKGPAFTPGSRVYHAPNLREHPAILLNAFRDAGGGAPTTKAYKIQDEHGANVAPAVTFREDIRRSTSGGLVCSLSLPEPLDAYSPRAGATLESVVAMECQLHEDRISITHVEGEAPNVVQVHIAETALAELDYRRPLYLDDFNPNPYADFVVGRNRRGEDVTLNLTNKHFLIGGESGGGKTGFMISLCTRLAMVPNVQLRTYWKDGGDGKPFKAVAHSYRSGLDPEDCLALQADLEDLKRTRARRAKIIEAHDWGDIYDINDEHGAAIDHPDLFPIVLLVDELRVFIGESNRTNRKKIAELVVDMASVARSVGIHLLAATQHPDAKTVPSGAKTNFQARVCFKVSDHGARDTILGAAGVDTNPHRDGVLTRVGMAFLKASDHGASPIEKVLLDWPDKSMQAEAIAAGVQARTAAGTLSGLAAGDDPLPDNREGLEAEGQGETFAHLVLDHWPVDEDGDHLRAVHLVSLVQPLNMGQKDISQRLRDLDKGLVKRQVSVDGKNRSGLRLGDLTDWLAEWKADQDNRQDVGVDGDEDRTSDIDSDIFDGDEFDFVGGGDDGGDRW